MITFMSHELADHMN